MRGRRIAAPLLSLAFAVAALAPSACNRTSPPEPVQTAEAGGDAGMLVFDTRARRDDAGRLIPRSAPPPIPADADIPPAPGRAPDWDLDPSDTARDYVERYLRATKRYAADTPCVHAQRSRKEGERTLVDARYEKSKRCTGAEGVRDTFAVDVVADRLALADPAKGAPLAPWPDGSAPGAPPSGKIPEEDDVHKWTGGLRSALDALGLTAIRVQYYGRGSYPVLTLAGWHAPFLRDAAPAKLREGAKRICEGTEGAPVGFFGGVDRANILRIRCPDGARWERL